MLLQIQSYKPDNLEQLFVHRNSWFSICDFAYTSTDDQWAAPLDNTIFCSPDDIYKGAIIYATPYGIEKFLKDIHPQIKNPYKLITFCYGPVNAVADYVNDPKIITWFGQANCDAINFNKFNLMPLGILADNELFNNRESNFNLFQQLYNKPKNNLLYMNFKVHEGEHVSLGGRNVIFSLFKDKLFCKTISISHTWRKPFHEYMEDMSECKFTLSPEGDMHDCYRHWEALLVGSIPIVHRSPLDAIFADLPVIIVDDYAQITEQFLNEKYLEMKNKKYNLNKLYMKYWLDLIKSK
jgi:hypothetical protein